MSLSQSSSDLVAAGVYEYECSENFALSTAKNAYYRPTYTHTHTIEEHGLTNCIPMRSHRESREGVVVVAAAAAIVVNTLQHYSESSDERSRREAESCKLAVGIL